MKRMDFLDWVGVGSFALVLFAVAIYAQGCVRGPAPGWDHVDPTVVRSVAGRLHADPMYRYLVEDVSSVYVGIRLNLGKQESSALTARWFREYRKEDMKRLLSLKLGASKAELIVGLIVAGGME